MKFKNLKLGDEVYVVPQQRRGCSKPSGYYTPITKVGTKYIYIKPGRFHPEDGKVPIKNGTSVQTGLDLTCTCQSTTTRQKCTRLPNTND